MGGLFSFVPPRFAPKGRVPGTHSRLNMTQGRSGRISEEVSCFYRESPVVWHLAYYDTVPLTKYSLPPQLWRMRESVVLGLEASSESFRLTGLACTDWTTL